MEWIFCLRPREREGLTGPETGSQTGPQTLTRPEVVRQGLCDPEISAGSPIGQCQSHCTGGGGQSGHLHLRARCQRVWETHHRLIQRGGRRGAAGSVAPADTGSTPGPTGI